MDIKAFVASSGVSTIGIPLSLNEVFNNIGQLLVEIKTNVVSLKDYSSGLYFFKVFTSKGIVIKKVIKE